MITMKKRPYSRSSFLTKPSTETSKCTTQNSRGLTVGWRFLSWIFCCYRRIWWRFKLSRCGCRNAPRIRTWRKGRKQEYLDNTWHHFVRQHFIWKSITNNFDIFQVVLYNSNLTNLNNITGDQIGAYFGYSLASGDLDGDGRDDVIIGAPMWTNYEIMGKYETGRVYVVYQGDQVTTISVASKLKIIVKKC